MAHGVSVTEVPTGVRPPVRTTAGLPVYVGTAPINLGDLDSVNVPEVFYTLAEAVAKYGDVFTSGLWSDYTLLEAVKAHFSVYSVAPIVCINVLDPDNTDHTNVATNQSHQLIEGEVLLQTYGGEDVAIFGIIATTVVVKNHNGSTTYVLDTDYTLDFDDDGFLNLSIVDGGAIGASDVLSITFTYFDPSGVTADDIIGGYTAGAYTGLEVVEQVLPRLRLVPGFLLAPKWSQTPEVAARMATIARSINGSFRAMALTDLSTDPGEIPTYAEAPAWKSDNGYTSVDSAPCWPLFQNGDDVYHLSTIIACRANLTDVDHQGIPFESPSNKAITGTAAVDDDGTEILLTIEQANALNVQGIVTSRNTFNGWRSWGNRTGGYPGTTDPKDAFIPQRRMGNYINNTLILTTERDVDSPGNRRQIDGVVGTVQSWLNGLISEGALLPGSKVEFRTEDNPASDVLDGIYRYRVTQASPTPAEDIRFIVEYDASLLAGLFE